MKAELAKAGVGPGDQVADLMAKGFQLEDLLEVGFTKSNVKDDAGFNTYSDADFTDAQVIADLRNADAVGGFGGDDDDGVIYADEIDEDIDLTNANAGASTLGGAKTPTATNTTTVVAVTVVAVVIIIAVLFVAVYTKRMASKNDGDAGGGLKSFENPMYASMPNSGAAVAATAAAATDSGGYMDMPGAEFGDGSSGYMDVSAEFQLGGDGGGAASYMDVSLTALHGSGAAAGYMDVSPTMEGDGAGYSDGEEV